ncbi:hypothetical protein COS64_04010 [archaeon CG06_land_8_20_14_3_00_37_11]|nr:MAG: hypothetical protein COS64_04010 [archaeon CG06_land_8_20_14_3_00_37_11]
MKKIGLSNFSLILYFLGFFIFILVPFYPLYYAFYYYYLAVPMPYFLVLLPVVFIILYSIYALLFILEAKIVLGLLNHDVKEGSFSTKQINHALILWVLSNTFNSIIESVLDKLLIPKTTIAELLFTLFGRKVGKNIHIGSPVFDPYLTEIGDNTVTGKYALILAHQMVGDNIYIKKTKIGRNVTIGAYAIISPGVTIEDNVIVGANSFVKQNVVLENGYFYAGVPARKIKKISQKLKH